MNCFGVSYIYKIQIIRGEINISHFSRCSIKMWPIRLVFIEAHIPFDWLILKAMAADSKETKICVIVDEKSILLFQILFPSSKLNDKLIQRKFIPPLETLKVAQIHTFVFYTLSKSYRL